MTASMRTLIEVAWLLAMPSTAAVVRGSDEAAREILIAQVVWADSSLGTVGKRIDLTSAVPHQSRCIGAIKRLNYANSPGLKILDFRPAGEITDKACRITRGELKPVVPPKAGRLEVFAPKKEALSMQVALPVLGVTKEHIDRHHL
jgi:hypothetical protein